MKTLPDETFHINHARTSYFYQHLDFVVPLCWVEPALLLVFETVGGDWTLSTLNARNGAMEKLMQFKGMVENAAYHRTGNFLIVNHERTISFIELADMKVQYFTSGYDYPALSPDEKSLAVRRAEAGSVYAQIVLFDMATGMQRTSRLVPTAPEDQPVHKKAVTDLVYLRDGQYLTYSAYLDEDTTTFYGLPADLQGRPEVISAGLHGAARLQWSPDDLMMVYRRGANYMITPLNNVGLTFERAQVIYGLQFRDQLLWSPDGQYVAFGPVALPHQDRKSVV